MRYKILGDSDCPLVHIQLDMNEKVKIERGAMAYVSNVDLEGKMNSSKKGLGGVLGAIGRSITSGESMFMTHATGKSNDSYLGIAPAIPGKINCLHVDGNKQYCLNTGAFLASDESVAWDASLNYDIHVASGIFGFTTGEGIVNEFHGSGTVLIQTRNVHNLAEAIRPFLPSSN